MVRFGKRFSFILLTYITEVTYTEIIYDTNIGPLEENPVCEPFNPPPIRLFLLFAQHQPHQKGICRTTDQAAILDV